MGVSYFVSYNFDCSLHGFVTAVDFPDHQGGWYRCLGMACCFGPCVLLHFSSHLLFVLHYCETTSWRRVWSAESIGALSPVLRHRVLAVLCRCFVCMARRLASYPIYCCVHTFVRVRGCWSCEYAQQFDTKSICGATRRIQRGISVPKLSRIRNASDIHQSPPNRTIGAYRRQDPVQRIHILVGRRRASLDWCGLCCVADDTSVQAATV
mmetsp:Transcript_13908/g.29665  ORF Transcript_13908/g.29665 Transcript_13908/m.29665 type:complete len:209 (+) Transcript_13908:400-1026(+)